jgi:hypothetical protein
MNWLLSRSELTQDGKFIHKKKGVAAVQEKAVQLIEKKRLGLFKSDMENDILSGALGNAEHTRRIHGVASQMPWKVGFQMLLGATRSVIDTRETLKMRLKRK